MATPREKSLPELLTELKDMVLLYARQEIVVPMKDLGRFAAFGVAGSAVLSLGLVLLVLALLRALQTETGSAFDGNWSWAPYGLTLFACGVVVGLAARAIGKQRRARERASQ